MIDFFKLNKVCFTICIFNDYNYSILNLSRAISEAKQNNQVAFNFLLETFWDDVFKFVVKRTKNQIDAEDITIEAFFKAFNKIDTFDPKFKFKTWLITIAKNTHFDNLRKQKNSISRQDIKDYEKRSHWIIDNSPSAEDCLINEQNLAELLKDIKKLKKQHQEIIHLRYFKEKSYFDISIQLKIPVNNVKVKLLRAKRLLAEIINKKND